MVVDRSMEKKSELWRSSGCRQVLVWYQHPWPSNESVIDKVTPLYIKFDDFFILTTDGVWDVAGNNYAVQIIHSFIAKSSNAICRYAGSRWEKLETISPNLLFLFVIIVNWSQKSQFKPNLIHYPRTINRTRNRILSCLLFADRCSNLS